MNRPRKQITVLTGAGMSAESGISTFRDQGGLWEQHRIEDVATPEAWRRDPQLVLNFYNQRRKQLLEVQPNAGHRALAELEAGFDVRIVTQNVDDLHERAGSNAVLHLHGELRKARSTGPSARVSELEGWELRWGDLCPDGHQLRPHIVWFGEEVPEIPNAVSIVERSDLMIVIGTSMNVYPAAGLIGYAPRYCPIFVIDPNATELHRHPRATIIREKAGTAVPSLVASLLSGGTSV